MKSDTEIKQRFNYLLSEVNRLKNEWQEKGYQFSSVEREMLSGTSCKLHTLRWLLNNFSDEPYKL